LVLEIDSMELLVWFLIAALGGLLGVFLVRFLTVHPIHADRYLLATVAALVGHGQPDEWDREWATETEQETRFRQAVLDLFERDGYRRDHLSLAWMEFKEPKPAPMIEAFSRDGVETVLYFSAAISADAIHSQYDVPMLVARARPPRDLGLVNLGAWNDHPRVIRAIKEKIDAQLG
jgi:hypothetical protein